MNIRSKIPRSLNPNKYTHTYVITVKFKASFYSFDRLFGDIMDSMSVTDFDCVSQRNASNNVLREFYFTVNEELNQVAIDELQNNILKLFNNVNIDFEASIYLVDHYFEEKIEKDDIVLDYDIVNIRRCSSTVES